MSVSHTVTTTFDVEGIAEVSTAFDSLAAKSEATTSKITENNEKTETSFLKLGTSIATLSTAGLMLEGTWQRVAEGQMSVVEGMLRSIPAIISMTSAVLSLVTADKAAAVASAIKQAIISGGTALPIIATSAAMGAAVALSAISSIPSMATGGIVTSPTIALLGEAGPEAVVPLNQSWNSQSRTVSIGQIIIQAARDPEETGESVIRHIRAAGE